RILVRDGATERMTKQIEIIERAAMRMNGLVRDLLDEVRLDEGQFALDRRQHEVRALVRDTIELFAPVAGEKRIRLDAQVATARLYAWCDRDRILQVLSNLVGNAIKFTPAGGSITLRVEASGTMALFCVEDTGPGIAPAELKKVFGR